MSDRASVRAAERLRLELHRRGLNQADLAGQIGWTQSKVSKVLNGETELTVNDLETLCVGLRLSMTEAVRDQGVEFCAEMTPLELRVFEEIRRRRLIDSLMVFMSMPPYDAPRAARRRPARKNHK
jgi:transcriptional regulator with XRE-family HTH domain